MLTKLKKQKKVIESQPKLRKITANNDLIIKRVETQLAALELYINIEDPTLFEAINKRIRRLDKKLRARRKYWVNCSTNRIRHFLPFGDLLASEGSDA